MVTAVFANLALPTQAALPQFSAMDWTGPVSGERTARLPVARPFASAVPEIAKPRITKEDKSARWWAVRRALAPEQTADPDMAIVRGFLASTRQRFAGLAPVPATLATAETARPFQVAYAAAAPGQLFLAPAEPLSATDGMIVAPPMRKGDHKWMRRPLPADTLSAKQQECIATAIYFEARGETVKGQAAVAQVVLNRVRNPAYPDTACGVVYQNAQLRNRCQFSFACDGIADRVNSRRARKQAEWIAKAVTKGELFIPEIGSSTHYFADYVRPKWAGSMVKMASIGAHHFFKTRKGGWR